jgi:hypothetical protein
MYISCSNGGEEEKLEDNACFSATAAALHRELLIVVSAWFRVIISSLAPLLFSQQPLREHRLISVCAFVITASSSVNL